MTNAQIFQIIGVLYVAIGIGILINPDHYKKMAKSFMESSPLLYMGGIAALVIGYLLVTFHNIWVKDWPVIITIIGWIALVKGLWLIVLPKTAIRISNVFIEQMTKFATAWALVVIILGGLCCWLGFSVL